MEASIVLPVIGVKHVGGERVGFGGRFVQQRAVGKRNDAPMFPALHQPHPGMGVAPIRVQIGHGRSAGANEQRRPIVAVAAPVLVGVGLDVRPGRVGGALH